MTPYRPLYDFWFSEPLPNSKLWFGKNKAVDDEIRDRFVSLLGAPHLEVWTRNPQGWISLILLHDQFPRNAFRDQPRMFAYDQRALECAKKGLSEGLLEKLNVYESLFLLLPLEHSENLNDQDESLARFKELNASAPAADKEFTKSILDFAEKHHVIISRFGRFPHRNQILGRLSSPEEVEFLKQPGSRF